MDDPDCLTQNHAFPATVDAHGLSALMESMHSWSPCTHGLSALMLRGCGTSVITSTRGPLDFPLERWTI
eukprot:1156235-Pelagomonas_calceolata.AAC.4